MRAFFVGILFLAAGCASVSARDRELARTHLSLAEQSLGAGDPRGALAEIETAVRHDPQNPEVRNLYGLLLHVAFGQNERAIAQYQRAIQLAPNFTEAKVNLSAVLMDEDRCAEVVPLLEKAREDLLYREPYLVENNLGWCKRKLGERAAGIRHLQNAVSLNPGFCLGYRNLGEAMEEEGRREEALHFFQKYAEHCPQIAESHHRVGLLLLESGDEASAREAFLACAERASGDLAEQCAREASLLGG